LEKRDLLRAAFDRAVAELEANEARAAGKTVRELWDAWFPSVSDTARGPNIRTHRKYIDRMSCELAGETFVLGDLAWSQCDPPRMNAWRAALGRWLSKFQKPLSAGTRDQVRLSLQACFTYHVKTRTIGSNPLTGIPREPGRVVRRQGFFTPEELDRFLAHCRPVIGAMLRTSIRCGGLRNTEVRLLRKSEIDHETREFVVMNKGRNGIRKTKRVLITDDIYDLVLAWSSTSPGEFVFANPLRSDGRPVPRATFWGWFNDACKASGVVLFGGEKPTLHHARHTWTQDMLDKGMPDRRIADQLGHASTAMLAGYGATRGKAAKEEVRRLMNLPVSRGARSQPPPPIAPCFPCPECKREWPDLRALVDCFNSHELGKTTVTDTSAKSSQTKSK
jgi:integrase